ncbi:MAG TPA: hypothetical protein PK876_06535 [Elusimicrobiota bacterium]|nr:hypothetical protein [Elusimicrobiota bacterium]HRY30733.1 hypothetical protein [Elusimicrobiota bacterium]
MSEQKKKEEKVSKENWSLTQLMLDVGQDKYRLIKTALRWAQEIKKRDQSTEPVPVLINMALKEILAGGVSLEEIEKLPPVPKSDGKPLELNLKALEVEDEKEKEKGKEKAKAKDDDEEDEDTEKKKKSKKKDKED